MKIAAIHVSDIHFEEGPNQATSLIPKIPDGLPLWISAVDQVYVLVSGDISYSGKEQQYTVATQAFSSLRTSLEQRCPDAAVHMVFAPGNHDCSIDDNDGVRSSLVDNIRRSKIDANYVSQCTKVQRDFRRFRESVGTTATVDTDILARYSFSKDTVSVRVDVINTAWMSQVKEQQGRIRVPLALLPDAIADVDVAVSDVSPSVLVVRSRDVSGIQALY